MDFLIFVLEYVQNIWAVQVFLKKLEFDLSLTKALLDPT